MGDIDKERRKIDEDILRCRANILRARDIIPPFGPEKQESDQKAVPEIEQPETVVNEEIKPSEPPKKAPIEIRSIPEFEEILSDSAGQDIPQFNLGEEILSEQRKVSSSKRRAPGTEPQAQKQESAALPAMPVSPPAPAPPASPQQRIIAEIIARDIEDMIMKRKQ